MPKKAPTLATQYVHASSKAIDTYADALQFYNLVLFMSSVALFSLAAQKMHNQK
jgi:hypothetical protein